jgi:hypothetical protein
VMEDVEGRHLVVGHDALRVDHGQSALRRSDHVRIELADPARAPTAAAGARLGWVVGDDPALPDEGSGTTIPASLRGTCRARSEQVG